MTPILEMENVTKRFGGLRAVKSVSLAMNAGEILFIIGPNGAGKTTVFNLISGFLHPNEGRYSSFRAKTFPKCRRIALRVSALDARFRS